MNIFNQFLIFPLRKFEPFRDYVYYSLVDRNIFFFDKPGENELVVTGLQPFLKDERVTSGLIYPVIFNRDFIQNQTLNHGRPLETDVLTDSVYSLSVLTFSRAHSGSTTAAVSASLMNRRGLIEYIGPNKPRFEYGNTRQNVLCSSEIGFESYGGFKNKIITENNMRHWNIFVEPVSGALTSMYAWPKVQYGWEPYCGPTYDLTKENDIPPDLEGIITQSTSFLLSTCRGCGDYGDPDAYSRNSPVNMEADAGNLNIPYISNREVGFKSPQFTSEWARYSITMPVNAWHNYRANAPVVGRTPRNLEEHWSEGVRDFNRGARSTNFWGIVPTVKISFMKNPRALMGAFAFWGPQLEYGLSASDYQYSGFAITSGGIDGKNLAPPLSSLFINRNDSFASPLKWRQDTNLTRLIAITADTPFGNNTDNPSFIFQSTTNVNWGDTVSTRMFMPYPEKSTAPGTNLIRNTDFSGAEVGDLIRKGQNNVTEEWYGDRSGRTPYFQNFFIDRLANTSVRIVSTGQINGANFVDYRFTRTSTNPARNDYRGTIAFHPEDAWFIKVNTNASYTFSVSCAVIDGIIPQPAVANRTFRVGFYTLNYRIRETSNGLNRDALLRGTWAGVNSREKQLTPSALYNGLTSISVTTQALSTANTDVPVFLVPYINIGAGGVDTDPTTVIPATSTFDFTLRMCGPKIEKGSEATPYVPTPTTLFYPLSPMTFSCYVKYISGARPVWNAEGSTVGNLGTVAGFIQRIGLLNPQRIRDGSQITVSMYAKIDGPQITSQSKLLFGLGIDDNRDGRTNSKTFLATNKWQRFQFTGKYRRAGNPITLTTGTVQDGRGFQFYIPLWAVENLGFDRNTTKFYFCGLQAEINAPKASDYIPTSQNNIATDNEISGILVEPQRSNLVIHSTNFATVSAGSADCQSNTSIAPDNSKTASTITFPTPTSMFYLTGCNFGKPNTRYTISFYVKLLNSDTTLNFNQHPLHQGSTVSFLYNPVADLIYGIQKSNSSDVIGVEPLIENWIRIYYTTMCSSLVQANTGRIWPGFTTSTLAPANSYLLWGVQIEEGDTPTSYIPASGQLVQRGKDILTLSGVNLETTYKSKINIANVSRDRSTIYFESVRKYNAIAPQTLLQFEELINNKTIYHNPISYGTTITTLSSTIFNTSINLPIPVSWVNNNIKTAFSFDNSIDYFALASNGTALSSTYTTNLKLTAYNFGATNFVGYLRKIMIFPDALNLPDLKTITT